MDKEHEAAAHAYRSGSSVLHEGPLTVMDTECVELMTFQSPDRGSVSAVGSEVTSVQADDV